MRTSLVRVLVAPLLALLFLVGLVLLGKEARQRLRDQDRYAFAFAAIDCAPPPGQERADFLGEVQYLGGLPDRLSLLDDNLSGRLAEAFAHHPWVAKVEGVELRPGSVQVRLVYREPVLAVLRAGVGDPGEARAVDAGGVLLPANARTQGLPLLVGDVPAPAGPAGSPWGDAGVESAARTADYLRPYQERLRLQEFRVVGGELVLGRPSGVRVLWGHAPGQEKDEARAIRKVERLLEYCARQGDLDQPAGREHDVRPQEQMRTLPQAPGSG